MQLRIGQGRSLIFDKAFVGNANRFQVCLYRPLLYNYFILFTKKNVLTFEPRWPLSDGETTKVFLRVWHMAKSRHLRYVLCKVYLPVLTYQKTHKRTKNFKYLFYFLKTCYVNCQRKQSSSQLFFELLRPIFFLALVLTYFRPKSKA